MVKRPTWILLAILILAVGAYFLVKNNPPKSGNSPTPTGDSFLITKSDGVLQSLHISDTQNHTFQMQRDLSKAWVITAPSSGVADQGLAGAAETQVGALRIVTILQPTADLASLGLSSPVYTLELGFVSGASHKIEVGNLTPTSSGYYVRFDSERIYVISQSGIDAIVNLLKAPPFPATATPVPIILSTDTPAVEIATPTP